MIGFTFIYIFSIDEWTGSQALNKDNIHIIEMLYQTGPSQMARARKQNNSYD